MTNDTDIDNLNMSVWKSETELKIWKFNSQHPKNFKWI